MFTYQEEQAEKDLRLVRMLLGSSPNSVGFRALGVSPPMLRRLIMAPHTLKLATLFSLCTKLGIVPIIVPWPSGASHQEASDLADQTLELYTEHVVNENLVKQGPHDTVYAVLLVRPYDDVEFHDSGAMPVRMPRAIPDRERDQRRRYVWPEPSIKSTTLDIIVNTFATFYRAARGQPVEQLQTLRDLLEANSPDIPTPASNSGSKPKGRPKKYYPVGARVGGEHGGQLDQYKDTSLAPQDKRDTPTAIHPDDARDLHPAVPDQARVHKRRGEVPDLIGDDTGPGITDDHPLALDRPAPTPTTPKD